MTKKYIPIIIIFLFSIICFLFEIKYTINVSYSPDLSGEYLFISNLVQTGFIPITKDINNNKHFSNVFAPRGTIVNSQGVVLPLKAVTPIYIYGIPYQLFNQFFTIAEFEVLFKFLLTIIFFLYTLKYIESFNLKNNKYTLLIILTLFILSNITTVIFFYSVFIFISFYYFNNWLKSDSIYFNKVLFLSSILLSLTIYFRYELVILLLPIGCYFLYLFIKKKYNILIFLYFLFPVIAIVSILLSNKVFYGDFLSFSYSFDRQSKDAFTTNNNIFSKVSKLFLLWGFNPPAFLVNSWDYIVLLFPFTTIPALLNFQDIKKYMKFFIIFVLISSYIIIYYGSNPVFHGYGQLVLDSSYVRYFAPIYLFLFVYAALFYSRASNYLFKNNSTRLFISSVIIVFGIYNFYLFNLTDYKSKEHYIKIDQDFQRVLDKNSIVFSNYWDKVLYTHYTVATMSKKINNFSDYYNVMRSYYLSNPQKSVYFIPEDTDQENEFITLINNDTEINCISIDYSSGCKLTRRD